MCKRSGNCVLEFRFNITISLQIRINGRCHNILESDIMATMTMTTKDTTRYVSISTKFIIISKSIQKSNVLI